MVGGIGFVSWVNLGNKVLEVIEIAVDVEEVEVEVREGWAFDVDDKNSELPYPVDEAEEFKLASGKRYPMLNGVWLDAVEDEWWWGYMGGLTKLRDWDVELVKEPGW